MKPRLLDLFCGAGGCAKGYQRAGFYVIGVDIHPQPHYCGDEFHRMDALSFPMECPFGAKWDGWFGSAAVHASPPCQAYSEMQKIHKNSEHADLVAPIRSKLKASGLPYVIENVKGAPLETHFMLCGTMFGLRIIKHRYFETSFEMPALMPCCNHHAGIYDPWHGKGRTIERMRDAQETPWIPSGGGGKERSGCVNNAIPPAYTEYIGKHLILQLDQR